MLKIRKLLSIIVAFAVIIAVFNCYSIGVKAYTHERTFQCTIDSFGQFNTNGWSDDYSGLQGVDKVILHITIQNNYNYQLTVRGNVELDKMIVAGGNDTVDMVFDRNSGTTTKTASIDDGTDILDTITCSIKWVDVTPSGGGDSSSDTSSKTSSAESHTHSFAWEDGKEATEDDNGEMIYKCSCGEVLYRVPTSAFNVFNRNTAEKIKNAKQGATVKIETSRWISFHKMVMQALAERPDVSLEVSFLDEGHKGNRLSFTIPAGTDTLSLLDENGFSGFLYLAGKFGTAN